MNKPEITPPSNSNHFPDGTSDPTSAHWYEPQHLERLVAAYIVHDQDRGRDRTVREFVAEFRGFAGSAAQKRVLDSTGLAREPLSALRNGDGLDGQRVAKLLEAMRAASRTVKAAQLGIIGQTHLELMFRMFGRDMDTFQYKRVVAESDGFGSLPWVLEVAFGYCPFDEDYEVTRLLVTGVNWSPGIGNPFKRTAWCGDGLDAIIARQRAGPEEPVIVFLHLAHPRVEYTDRGKSAISFTTISSSEIAKIVEAVTAKWAKQRKAEERHASARLRREAALAGRRDERVTAKQAAYDAIPAAYLKASANDTLPAKARQIMYAARGEIQERTGKRLDDKYFTQTLLPDFMAEHPELTARWKVVFDARGHLIEPHTHHSVPLGTLEVNGYLQCLEDPRWSDPAASMPGIETCGPSGRYGALLFCEKEGFNDLFRAVRLAERYDLAIMSTKGVSVTAARRLVDEVCARYKIPLFVLHDFDKSGLTILRTLQCDTRRYTFSNQIEVIDLGLRLADAEAYGLESEAVQYREKPESVRCGLRKTGATEDEIKFLLNRRVELNAFLSDKLVDWITAKLDEHGVRKVIPGTDVLAEAYRREHQSRYLKNHFGPLVEQSRRHMDGLAIAPGLHEEVTRRLEEDRTLSWDEAVASIAEGDMLGRK